MSETRSSPRSTRLSPRSRPGPRASRTSSRAPRLGDEITSRGSATGHHSASASARSSNLSPPLIDRNGNSRRCVTSLSEKCSAGALAGGLHTSPGHFLGGTPHETHGQSIRRRACGGSYIDHRLLVGAESVEHRLDHSLGPKPGIGAPAVHAPERAGGGHRELHCHQRSQHVRRHNQRRRIPHRTATHSAASLPETGTRSR